MESLINDILIAQLILAIPGIIINLPHIYILCQSALRTSSTNSILIGIGICDILVLCVFVHDRVVQFWFPSYSGCLEVSKQTQWISDLQRDILKQTSFWLGVFLALIRLLIMKYPSSNQHISNQKFGYLLVTLMYSISFSLSLLFFLKVNVPDAECPLDTEVLERKLKSIEIMSASSQILISLIYPILAVLLISVIRKSRNQAVFTLSKTSTLERHRLARMILIMTVLYVICSAPCGFLDFSQLVFIDHPIFKTMWSHENAITSLVFCLNAMSHSVLNFFMSSKYRQTAKSILCRSKKEKSHAVTVTKFSISVRQN